MIKFIERYRPAKVIQHFYYAAMNLCSDDTHSVILDVGKHRCGSTMHPRSHHRGRSGPSCSSSSTFISYSRSQQSVSCGRSAGVLQPRQDPRSGSTLLVMTIASRQFGQPWLRSTEQALRVPDLQIRRRHSKGPIGE